MTVVVAAWFRGDRIADFEGSLPTEKKRRCLLPPPEMLGPPPKMLKHVQRRHLHLKVTYRTYQPWKLSTSPTLGVSHQENY